MAEFAGNAIISLVMSAVMSVFMIAVKAGFGSGYLRAVFFSWLLGASSVSRRLLSSCRRSSVGNRAIGHRRPGARSDNNGLR